MSDAAVEDLAAAGVDVKVAPHFKKFFGQDWEDAVGKRLCTPDELLGGYNVLGRVTRVNFSNFSGPFLAYVQFEGEVQKQFHFGRNSPLLAVLHGETPLDLTPLTPTRHEQRHG